MKNRSIRSQVIWVHKQHLKNLLRSADPRLSEKERKASQRKLEKLAPIEMALEKKLKEMR